MTLDLRTWRIYCGVVDSHSVTATAERFFVSQPAVSLLMRKIERHYGAPLLYRGGRQIWPTEAGLAVYRYAREVIKADEEVRALVAELNEGMGGRVTLGATHMLGSYYLPPVLTEFARTRPDAEISVDVVSKHQLWPSLLSGDLDFAITTRQGMPEDLVCREFHSERMVVVCGPTHPLAQLASVSRADLLQHELVAFSRDTGLIAHIEAALRGPNPDAAAPRIAMHLSHAEAIKRVVQCNLGYAVLFECAVKVEVRLGLLRDITPPEMDVSYQPFAIVHRARKHFSPLQHQLLEFFVESDARLVSTTRARPLSRAG